MTASPEPRVTALVAAAPRADAMARARILERAERLAGVPGTVLLATCHRVELLAGDQRAVGARDRAAMVAAGMQTLAGVDAARHVIGLALGIESAVVGEDQVLHQLRTAVADARARGRLGGDLGPLVDAALRAGRLGRSWRPADAGHTVAPDRPDRSIADRAVRLATDRLGSLAGRSVLVVGTGEMGRVAAHGLRAAGASVHVASRTAARAADLAAELGGTALATDPGAAIARMEAVILALGGAWSVASSTGEALMTVPLVVDLSMPPALAPDLRARLGERCVDIDALATADRLDPRIERYRSRLADLAEQTLVAYLRALEARRSSAADRLAERVERQRRAGLEAYLRERPDLDLAVRRDLEALTRDLSARLFREPLARLARDPDGRRRRALDELFGA